MKKRVCFSPSDTYYIVATSNVKGLLMPNSIAHIYEQSDNASVKSKKVEFTDFRSIADAETAMDDAINHLIMLHAGRRPTAVIDILETNQMIASLNKLQAISKSFEQQ